MRKLKTTLIVLAIFFTGGDSSFAQGCSDAGFCTIGSFKPNNSDSLKGMKNQLKAGTFAGTADHTISVYGVYLEFNRQLNEKFGLDAKLTSISQAGNGVSVYGLSDIFLNARYKTGERLSFTLGSKIPLSNANRTQANLPLPLDYQSSLGTFDLIFGVGYEIKRIQLVAAIQQPLTQNNNQFTATNYPINSKLRTFQSTNKFERSGDVLLRISYPLKITSKLKLTPSILPIYHLANDRFTDEFNTKLEIKGSQGLTVNGNIYLDYDIKRNNVIQFNVGRPFIVRDARPDGLTRSIIASLEYRVRF